MKMIDPKEIHLSPFTILDQEWALLVGGAKKPNPMTVSWGGMGTLWNRPTVTVYVRPTRYTYELLNAHPEFTLNFLSEEHRGAMELCGSQSGQDLNKWTATGLHPESSEMVEVPRVAESSLVFECKTMAFQDLDPDRFLSTEIAHEYPLKDYHRVYWGQVVCAWKA